MKNPSVSFKRLLSFLNLGLVFFVVSALLFAALSVLNRLALENANSKVRLAALSAANEIHHFMADTASTVNLLSDRPTMQRLLVTDNQTELTLFLETFRKSGNLDGCAIFKENRLFASGPDAPFWSSLNLTEGTGIYLERDTNTLILSAIKKIPGRNDTDFAVAVKFLNEATEQRLSEATGVRILIRVLNKTVAGNQELKTFDVNPALTASVPIQGPEIVQGLQLEASLSMQEATRLLKPLGRWFTGVACSAGLLAVALALWAGARLTAPIRQLKDSVGRIAAGDLATPVGKVTGNEFRDLAETMETMRFQLRQTTDNLKNREVEAKALLAGIVEGVFAVDDERHIRFINPQGALLLGLDSENIIGKFCGDVLRPIRSKGNRPCDDNCPIIHARSRGSSQAVEQLETGTGRRTVIITSAPPSGARQVQILRDETEIETARRQRDAFLANLTHELKTPLAAQLVSIEMLRANSGQLDKNAELDIVTSLQRTTLRLCRLIDNLLESVRIETGKVTIRRTSVILEAVVDEAIDMIEPLLEARKQRVVKDIPLDLPSIDGDPSQLTQVMVNLLINSHKFCPEGSTIWVGAAHRDDRIYVWVEDEGPGLPASQSFSIFDQFQRASTGTEGIGLGLWIVKSIIELHGGQIKAGPSEKGGAKFTLIFSMGQAV